ncbi:MAG: DegT/DnrJ/EryC1/StrS family aminotransferase [Candidatus Omnitrophica bacterium]|nr:DegT/DnrJ/EryC1/StrS family aminotransferase [Candidatus Omnitrophota bacterium]
MKNKLALYGGEKTRLKPFVSHAIIGDEEKRRVNEVLECGMLSGFIAQKGDKFLGGKQIKEFEALIKEYFNVKEAVAINSATAGLHVALGACGVGPGDEVIVTPYTMSASATAIIMVNATPVFVDITDDTFCLDSHKIKAAITPRTKAIMVVHLFGHPADMDPITRVAAENNLHVIEDCAQAPGAIYKDKMVGTIGDVGIFSLNQHKTITCGEGGFAVTNNEKLALRMQLLRNHGEVIVDKMEEEDISNMIGFNYRMTELEAAVAVGQFRRLDELNDYRIGLAKYLTDKLSKFDGLILPEEKEYAKHVYFVYPIKIDEKTVGCSRDSFAKALNAEGIPFGEGYVRPIYLEPMYQKKIAYGKSGWPFTGGVYEGEVDYSKGICPVTERMYEKELLLTGVCKYPHTKKDIDFVADAFEKIFDNIEDLKRENKF